MELRKDLELIEVAYENDDKKAILRFLDEDNGELLEVNFNKQKYDNGKYIDDDKKAEEVEKWCQEYFDIDFDMLYTKQGESYDVYKYPNFNSLWEADIIEKFDVADKGKIINTEIKEVVDTGNKISIKYDWNGKTYETKFQYSDYIEVKKQWFVNPQKKRKQFKKFEELFGVSVANADEIIGKDIMVEIKVAFKEFAYGEIKKPNWA